MLKEMNQIHQRKMQVARRVEQANLSQEARELPQEQQRLFQFDQQMFALTVKRQMKEMHNRLNQYAEYHNQSLKTNQQLKHEIHRLKQENITLKTALKYGKVGDAHSYSHNSNLSVI